jgi:hypothetical protein
MPGFRTIIPFSELIWRFRVPCRRLLHRDSEVWHPCHDIAGQRSRKWRSRKKGPAEAGARVANLR